MEAKAEGEGEVAKHVFAGSECLDPAGVLDAYGAFQENPIGPIGTAVGRDGLAGEIAFAPFKLDERLVDIACWVGESSEGGIGRWTLGFCGVKGVFDLADQWALIAGRGIGMGLGVDTSAALNGADVGWVGDLGDPEGMVRAAVYWLLLATKFATGVRLRVDGVALIEFKL